MAAADYDGDGFVDLISATSTTRRISTAIGPVSRCAERPPNYLFRNQRGVFSDVTMRAYHENNNRYSSAAAWCDYVRWAA
jgi:hypothetical protein